MTPAEKYYAFLDRVSPMNLLLVADLDRALDIGLVAECWPHFVSRRALPRVQVRPDLTIGEGGPGQIDFVGLTLPSTEWDAQLSRESREPFGTDRPMRCLYLASPDENRSRVAFVVHHAIVDGRVGIAELQAFIRALDGQDLPSETRPPLVLAPTKVLPWQQDRRLLGAVVHEIRARNERVGQPEPVTWAHPPSPRHPRFFSLTLCRPDAEPFLGAVRRHGVKAYSAMAAAWLSVVARRVVAKQPTTLQLATPVDLAERGPDPDVPTAPVIGVIAQRYRVEPDAPWELATEIAAGLAAALERGEGELFFHLTRAEHIDDLDAGARVVGHALATAAPAVSVTNLGVVDPGSDPSWVRSMCGYLAPTPNQVIFVSGLGYRGRLVHSISTDDTQLAPDLAAALVTGYPDQIALMSRPA
jgi:hypothetical protein